MLERLDSPANVIAFRAVGHIDEVDYERVLDPAVRDMLERQGELRFVYVLGDAFEGYTAGAAWEDSKMGFGHLHKWKRCAVVTNHDWVRHLIGMFAWMMSGEIKVFDVTQESEAITWAGSGEAADA